MISLRLDTSPIPPDLRVLKALDLEVLEILLCIAAGLCPPLSATDCPLIYLPLCHSLTTSMSSLVCLSVLPCLSLHAFMSTSMCTVVDLCVLPCRPLCAPLSTSVCSLVCLCVLPCRPLCAPCQSLSMFGRASSWALDVETTAIFLIYCLTMNSKMCRHEFLVCVCSVGYPIFV